MKAGREKQSCAEMLMLGQPMENLIGHSGMRLRISGWTEYLTIISKQDNEPRLESIMIKRQRELKAKMERYMRNILGKILKITKGNRNSSTLGPTLKLM